MSDYDDYDAPPTHHPRTQRTKQVNHPSTLSSQKKLTPHTHSKLPPNNQSDQLAVNGRTADHASNSTYTMAPAGIAVAAATTPATSLAVNVRTSW